MTNQTSKNIVDLEKEITRLEEALYLIAHARDLIGRKSVGEEWCVDTARKALKE